MIKDVIPTNKLLTDCDLLTGESPIVWSWKKLALTHKLLELESDPDTAVLLRRLQREYRWRRKTLLLMTT